MIYVMRVLLCCCLVLTSGASRLNAEPTSGSVTIAQLRPYGIPGGPGAVFGYWGGSKEMYATLLTALVTNRPVMVELSNSTGCNSMYPWETLIQSVRLAP
jgi:hypothetical protein